MIAVIQRVNHSYVKIGEEKVASIQKGILCLLGVQRGDNQAHMEKLIQKISDLRIFSDSEGKMNLSLKDLQAELLLVSQFTLAGDCRKGKRPSFTDAEEPTKSKVLFEGAVTYAKSLGLRVESGVFQADMQVGLENDGPVTFILEVKD